MNINQKNTTQKYTIVRDRIEIYEDFTINLLNYIFDYYLDKDTLNNDVDIKNHYNWCFNKVCDEFKAEDLDFSTNISLRNYFHEFFYYQFYKRNNQNTTLSFYESFWRNIFDIDKQNNKNIVGTLIELYNIFDLSINKEKNIFELI